MEGSSKCLSSLNLDYTQINQVISTISSEVIDSAIQVIKEKSEAEEKQQKEKEASDERKKILQTLEEIMKNRTKNWLHSYLHICFYLWVKKIL